MNFQLEVIVTAIRFLEHLLQTKHLFLVMLLLIQLHLNKSCFNPAWHNKKVKDLPTVPTILCVACDKIKSIRQKYTEDIFNRRKFIEENF